MIRKITYILLSIGLVGALPALNIGQTASADDWDDRWEDYQEAREEYYEDYYDDLEDYYEDLDDYRWSRYRVPVHRHHHVYHQVPVRSVHPVHPVHMGWVPVRPVPCWR